MKKLSYSTLKRRFIIYKKLDNLMIQSSNNITFTFLNYLSCYYYLIFIKGTLKRSTIVKNPI